MSWKIFAEGPTTVAENPYALMPTSKRSFLLTTAHPISLFLSASLSLSLFFSISLFLSRSISFQLAKPEANRCCASLTILQPRPWLQRENWILCRTYHPRLFRARIKALRWISPSFVWVFNPSLYLWFFLFFLSTFFLSSNYHSRVSSSSYSRFSFLSFSILFSP